MGGLGSLNVHAKKDRRALDVAESRFVACDSRCERSRDFIRFLLALVLQPVHHAGPGVLFYFLYFAFPAQLLQSCSLSFFLAIHPISHSIVIIHYSVYTFKNKKEQNSNDIIINVCRDPSIQIPVVI